MTPCRDQLERCPGSHGLQLHLNLPGLRTKKFVMQESLTEQEVTLITAVFQAASGIQRSPRGDSYSFSQSYRGGDFDELVGQLTARALAGLDGIDYNSHFQDMMNRLEYAFFPEMNVEQQMKDMMERYSSPHIGQEPEALKVCFAVYPMPTDDASNGLLANIAWLAS